MCFCSAAFVAGDASEDWRVWRVLRGDARFACDGHHCRFVATDAATHHAALDAYLEDIDEVDYNRVTDEDAEEMEELEHQEEVSSDEDSGSEMVVFHNGPPLKLLKYRRSGPSGGPIIRLGGHF